jgi:hypothetical protein
LTCQPCDYTCEECTTEHVCNKCDAANYRIKDGDSCICMDGYFDNGVAKCEPCNLNVCVTCETTANTCKECKDPRVDPAACPCPDGMWEDASEVC